MRRRSPTASAAEEEAARAAAEANKPEEPAKGAEGAGGSTAGGTQGGTDAQGATGGSQSASPSSGAGSGTNGTGTEQPWHRHEPRRTGRHLREEPTDDPAQHRADAPAHRLAHRHRALRHDGGHRRPGAVLQHPGRAARHLRRVPRGSHCRAPARACGRPGHPAYLVRVCRASASPSLPASCPTWP